MPIQFLAAVFILLVSIPPFSALAHDVTDRLSVDTTVTGVFQHGEFSGIDVGDTSRGTVVTDVGVNFQPTDRDELDLVVSFASGNALNAVSPYSAHPLYADDLEDDLKGISGRGRDHLLTAWYKRTFSLSGNTSLGLTGGIIDATGYVDDNAFANDEVGQFMNEAFVNNTLMVPPSFEAGIAWELDIGDPGIGDRWSLRGVWMRPRNVDPDNGLDENYHYFAGQLGLGLDTRLGEGNYRLAIQGTSDDFASSTGTGTEGLFGIGLSMDQQLGDTFGVFARLGRQDDDAAIDHDTLYAGGFRIDGGLWGRASDEAGFGYAYLDGGNGNVEETDVLEGYIKFRFSKYFDLSLDVQYLDERTTGANDPSGFVYGARVNADF